MVPEGKTLIEEHNIISLRTAFIIDVDGSVALQLLPAESSMSTEQNIYKTEYWEWLKAYYAILYQHTPSASGMLIRGIKQMAFEQPPKLKLLWTDSGNSVAVYLDDEPWAFIDESTQKGYSKGVLNSENKASWWHKTYHGTETWDQNVFKKTFFPKVV
jgi:hypothetical protein